MECKVKLLRRPLPPKFSKLPSLKTSYKAKNKHVQDETVNFEKQPIFFETGIDKPLYHASIQNILYGHRVSEEITCISLPQKSFKRVRWYIPEREIAQRQTPIFFPAYPATLTKNVKKRKIHKKITEIEVPSELKRNLVVKTLRIRQKIPSFVLRPTNFVPHFNVSHSSINIPTNYLTKIKAFKLRYQQETGENERSWTSYFRRNQAISLKINNFSEQVFLPKLQLPRRPLRQAYLESFLGQEKTTAHVPKPPGVIVSKSSKIIRSRDFLKETRNMDDSMPHAVYGEGFKIYKTIAATQYETVIAMVNLAILNCQLFARNALNLKGFFIINCPDLTPLAHQLIYINLSYNDLSNFPTEVLCVKNLQVLILRNNPIKEIPSAIQQLKFLRNLNMAFNLLTSLPPGLFNLSHLKKLDIAYNNVTIIPNDIQKLRSLEKFSIDGNELVTFPAAILRLDLKKLSFENNFTYFHFWKHTIPTTFKPPPLTQLAALVFLKNKLQRYYEDIPAEIAKHLRWTSTCDWCFGPKVGEGFTTIKTCNIFGGKYLPILFCVCSPTCFKDLKKGNLDLYHSVLLKDWSKVWGQSDSTAGVTPGEVQETMYNIKDKPELTAWKARALPAVISLWSSKMWVDPGYLLLSNGIREIFLFPR